MLSCVLSRHCPFRCQHAAKTMGRPPVILCPTVRVLSHHLSSRPVVFYYDPPAIWTLERCGPGGAKDIS